MTEQSNPEIRDNERLCPECGGVVNKAAAICVHCGVPLNPMTPIVSGPGTRTGTGLDPKLAGALTYLCGFVTGIIFLLIEKEDEFVRFHAWQAIVFGGAVFAAWVALYILAFVLVFIPIIGGILITLASLVVWVGALVLWIVLMVKAYQGERFTLPVLGDLAKNLGASMAR